MANQNNINENKIYGKSNEELIDNIFRINDRAIKNIRDKAILEIIQMSINLKNDFNKKYDLINSLDEDGNEIIRLYDKVTNRDLDFNLIIKSDDIVNELGIDYFKNLRQKTYELLLSISGYITEISYINEISREILYRVDRQKRITDIIEDVDLNKFYQNIYSFLSEDLNSVPHKIKDLVSVIPLRTSKNKYFDIIKKSIIRGLSQSNEHNVNLLLERYKTIFNGTMEGKYGQKFDCYFRKTHEFKQFDFKSATLEDIEKIDKNTSQILHEMKNIINIILQIGLITNRFIVINLVKENMSANSDESVQEILKLWSQYHQNIGEDSVEEINRKCQEKISYLGKSFTKDNLKLQELIDELYKKENYIDDKSNEKLLFTQKILSYINDDYLEKEELLFVGKSESVSIDYLEQAVDNFIEFIRRNIKNMDNRERKVRMRRLLCLTDFPFEKPDDFFHYLKNSVENSSSKLDLIININLVAEVIAKYKSIK